MTKKPTPAQQRALKKLYNNIGIQQRVQQMTNTGDMYKVAELIAMSHQLFTIANGQIEEAYEIMGRYGLNYGKIKTMANNIMQSFEAYEQVFAAMIHGDGEAWEQISYDNDTLNELIDFFMHNKVEVKRGPYVAATIFLPEKKHQL